MIRKIDAIVLFVENLEKCLTFYRDMLGFKVTFSDDVSHALKLEDQHLVLLQVSAAAQQVSEEALALGKGVSHRVMLCAGVEDVRKTYETLTAKGLTFIKPPIDQPWGRCTAYFADPEGNIWELWHPLE